MGIFAHIVPQKSRALRTRQRDITGTPETEDTAAMARRIRSSQLESRTARLKLPIRRKPYTVRVAPGIRLGYRRNETAGSWSVIVADGRGGNWMKQFAIADDHEDANGGDRVFDFWRAQDKARVLARGGDGADDGRPVTADVPAIAVKLEATTNPAAADAFIAYLFSPEAKQLLATIGLVPPDAVTS